MADELSAVAGVVWEDENAVRLRVAAGVQAGASTEAQSEKLALEASWAALHAAEDALQNLEQVPAANRSATYQFELVAARRAVDEAGREVRRKQAALEEGQRLRTRAAMLTMAHTAAQIPRLAANQPRQERGGNRDEAPQAQRLVVMPAAPSARARPRALQAVARSERAGTGEAVDEYQGGPVLPSVHQVGISDLIDSAASGKYVDDGDVTLFEARQMRRRNKRDREAEVKVKDEEEGSDKEDDGEVEEEEEETTLRIGATRFVVSTTVFNSLLDYQKVGVEWLLGLHERRVGGILGDEMGLGKTIQIAAMLHALARADALKGPVLIVCPLTVLAQWVKELHKWAPMLRAIILHASGTSTTTRGELLKSVKGTPAVVLTTYSAVTTHIEEFRGTGFQYVVLDEGHKISNPATAVTNAVKSFYTPHRIILTGSPIQNTLKELWCLFDFVCPGLLGTLEIFIREFEEPINGSKNPRATPLALATAVECAKALRDHIAPYMLRRLKRDVNANLPPKHERIIRCSLTDSQLAEYLSVLLSPEATEVVSKATLAKFDNRIDKFDRDEQGCLRTGPPRNRGLTEALHRLAFRVRWSLRFVCNHVQLRQLKDEDIADGGDGKKISFRSNNPVDYEGSAKLKTLRDLLANWKKNNHKVLVFSQTCMMLDILENMAEQEKYKYIRMDGTTPSKHRPLLIDAFNNDESIFVALLTTKVGGLGVNLTGADRVVIFDPDWNPVTDEQARERSWRIGQKREVCIYRMISSGTVEEAVLHRQLAKTYVADKVLLDPSVQRFFSFVSLEDSFLLGPEYANRVSESHRYLVANTFQGEKIQQEADQELEREDREENKCASRVLKAEADGLGEGDDDDEVKREPAVDEDAETAMLQSLVDGKNITASGDGVTRRLAAISAQATLRKATTAAPAQPTAPGVAVQRRQFSSVVIPPRPRHKS